MCIFPLTSSLHPAVLIVWGTQHGTHSFFVRELCGGTAKTKYNIVTLIYLHQYFKLNICFSSACMASFGVLSHQVANFVESKMMLLTKVVIHLSLRKDI